MGSCKNTEVTDVVLQAKINDYFFRAVDARIIENDDGTFLIQGITASESITMKVESLDQGTYNFGEMSENYASYDKANGASYFTNPNGDGKITIRDYNQEGQTASGSFEFMAIQEGVDTIAVQNGLFYQADIRRLLDDSIAIDPNTNAGTFICLIDDNPFNPFSVSALLATDMINVKGFNINKSISIKVPFDVEPGSYPLPSNGFSLSYEDENGFEDSNSGNVIVFSHNLILKKIKGTFFFLTESKVVTLGQFNVTYE